MPSSDVHGHCMQVHTYMHTHKYAYIQAKQTKNKSRKKKKRKGKKTPKKAMYRKANVAAHQ